MHYKKLNDNGEIEWLITYNNYCPNITDPLVIEITEEEYNVLLAEMEAANAPDLDEISDEEALNIILGVSE